MARILLDSNLLRHGSKVRAIDEGIVEHVPGSRVRQIRFVDHLPETPFLKEQISHFWGICKQHPTEGDSFYVSDITMLEWSTMRGSFGYKDNNIIEILQAQRIESGLLDRFASYGDLKKSLHNYFSFHYNAEFRDMCKIIGQKHSLDAAHLFTAESNKIDIFLTADGKFRRRYDQIRLKIGYTVQTLLPSEYARDRNIEASTSLKDRLIPAFPNMIWQQIRPDAEPD